jgi:hypothetical protein
VVAAADKPSGGSYTLTDFSNYGEYVTVAAPGKRVFSTIISGGWDGSYGLMSGTSMAAPVVTGLTAMVWSVNQDWSAKEVKNIITSTANIPVSPYDSCDTESSYHMVNAAAAVQKAVSLVTGTGSINYYEVFSDVVASWEDAEQYCESLGGHLATISSQEENDYVYQLMRNAGYKNAYLGMTDRDVEGTWVWVNGERGSYTNWHSGEPSNGYSSENYAMFYFKFTEGTWNDGDFGGSTDRGGKAFICEWDTESAYNAYLAQ